MFQIDTGITLPSRKSNPTIETLKVLKVGESFIIPEPEYKSTAYARTWSSQNGIKIATRKTNGGVRVWRLE